MRQWSLLRTPLLSTLLTLPSLMLCFVLEDMDLCLIYQTTKPWKKQWEWFMKREGLPQQFAMDQLVSGCLPCDHALVNHADWALWQLAHKKGFPLLSLSLASFWSVRALLSELILIWWTPPWIWKMGNFRRREGKIIIPFFHIWSLAPAQICKKILFSSIRIIYTAGQLVFCKICFALRLRVIRNMYSKHLKLSFSSILGG